MGILAFRFSGSHTHTCICGETNDDYAIACSHSNTHTPPLSLSLFFGALCLSHAGLFMGILYNTSSTNMFAKCVRILYGNLTCCCFLRTLSLSCFPSFHVCVCVCENPHGLAHVSVCGSSSRLVWRTVL